MIAIALRRTQKVAHITSTAFMIIVDSDVIVEVLERTMISNNYSNNVGNSFCKINSVKDIT